MNLLKYTIEKIQESHISDLSNSVAMLCVAGSRLYGTDHKDSDWDIRGVIIPPKDYWVGARKFEIFERKEDENKIGITLYDIRKFVDLVSQGSPNVIELLFAHPIMCLRSLGKIQKKMIGLISRQSYMNYHNYGLSQVNKSLNKNSSKPSRKDSVDKFGYDTKFAMHAFRLLGQAKEILETGKLTFPRPDAQFLKDVKDGKAFKDKDEMFSRWNYIANETTGYLKDGKCIVIEDKDSFEDKNQLLMEIFDMYCGNYYS